MLAHANRHMFNVSEYLAIYDNAVLPRATRTELIKGEILELSPLGHRHAKTQVLLFDFLRSVFKSQDIFMTGSIIANDSNMPEPDVYVLKPGQVIENNYPRADQVQLVVEVGDSTIQSDMINNGEGRLSIYAEAKIQCVWVIDVNKKTLYEFEGADGSFFSSCNVHRGDCELFNCKVNIGSLVA